MDTTAPRSRWMEMPNARASPEVGFTSEERMPISVDLPAPLGPSSAKKSPGSTRSDTPFSASTPLA